MPECRVQYLTSNHVIFFEETQDDPPMIGEKISIHDRERDTHVHGHVVKCVLTIFDYINNNKAIPIWVAVVEAAKYRIKGYEYDESITNLE